ncbi:MAG TPA: CBS domain-containing protein [Bacilli bacterium]|nr:MAG: inosine 5'-monophosphate dehydrogenase [Tenericutes bacterium ADurb.BinA124]HPX84155.1 CBS domain-containing protein [Bacilli bacterium]HQC74778.1 CBS domain-containing protein [Bacilli bacterium]
MNILAFIKPKSEVVFVYDDDTIQEALNKLEQCRFSSIPILTRDGNYFGTLTEGDLLWAIKNQTNFDFKKAETILISQIRRFRDYVSINMNSKMDELIMKSTTENFVPVVDDHNLFIGIITRKNIINYFFEHNFIVL